MNVGRAKFFVGQGEWPVISHEWPLTQPPAHLHLLVLMLMHSVRSRPLPYPQDKKARYLSLHVLCNGAVTVRAPPRRHLDPRP